jgi:hypothetical protein
MWKVYITTCCAWKLKQPLSSPKSHSNAFHFMVIVCFVEVLWSLWILYYNICAYEFAQNDGDYGHFNVE